MRNELALQGSFAYAPEDFANALSWLGDGRVDPSEWITHADLSEGRACFERLVGDPGGTIKILLDPSPSYRPRLPNRAKRPGERIRG